LISAQAGGASKSATLPELQKNERSKDRHLPTTKEKRGQKRQPEVQQKLPDGQEATQGHTVQSADHKKMPVDLKSRIVSEKELHSCSR